MPNVCEICGAVDTVEEEAQAAAEAVFLHDLHICESCQKDRQAPHF